MKPLERPFINRNGTDPKDLLNQVMDVVRSLREVERAIAAATPNGRDYYLAGPDALRSAEEGYRARAEIISQMKTDFEELAERLMDFVYEGE